MKSPRQKKEYASEEEIVALLRSRSLGAMPKEASLRATLDRCVVSVPSPYASRRSARFGFRTAIAVAMFALVLLVSGGAAYFLHGANPSNAMVPKSGLSSSVSDASDASVATDIKAIDVQMSGLDSDSSNI